MEAIDWNYAIATLLIRFVGIFVVLGILQVIMQLSGRVFARLDLAKSEKEGPTKTPGEAPTMTADEAAAVGMALYLYDQRR
jgi:Na+-transporting methylmalonyl-CoA/oxaloacetate decarboxylase gamma subunit